jgi:hypothetical protein
VSGGLPPPARPETNGLGSQEREREEQSWGLPPSFANPFPGVLLSITREGVVVAATYTHTHTHTQRDIYTHIYRFSLSLSQPTTDRPTDRSTASINPKTHNATTTLSLIPVGSRAWS